MALIGRTKTSIGIAPVCFSSSDLEHSFSHIPRNRCGSRRTEFPSVDRGDPTERSDVRPDIREMETASTKHVELAESALASIDRNPQSEIPNPQSATVIFPESPMNFAYEEDEEFRNFVHAFAAKNNVNVLFNSAEPDAPNNKYFNSAVLVGTDGKEIAQYDKIYLLPFGESVPAPLQAIVPAFVGSFSYGKEYDLLPIGDAKAGIMICFESHFGELSREYVRDGADVLIEMTNDGYLGPTPVLRQHLANAVFRAVETNRPVLRVTNVGITAYVNERGEVSTRRKAIRKTLASGPSRNPMADKPFM